MYTIEAVLPKISIHMYLVSTNKRLSVDIHIHIAYRQGHHVIDSWLH